MLELYRARAAKDRMLEKIYRQAIFHQAVSLLCVCFQVTFSPEQLKNMENISFRSGVLVLPLGEARIGTPRATKLEFHISPTERMLFLARYNRQKTTRLRVKVEAQSAILIGYKFEILRHLNEMKSSVLQLCDDEGVYKVEKYADFSPNGDFVYGINFPKRNFHIPQLVATICDLRVET